MTRIAIGMSLVLLVVVLATFIAGQAQQVTQPVQTPGSAPPLSNPLKVALLKWYHANIVPTNFPVGSQPYGLAFDGANIWSANFGDGTVSKVRTSDGMLLGT